MPTVYKHHVQFNIVHNATHTLCYGTEHCNEGHNTRMLIVSLSISH